ncbi:hypothetical protein ACJV45_06340, partial [Gardnerella sp. Marseille-Q9181]|uniref:hypothetical protein n=1 Tax=Gardnerella sp. Marseille-Q9181 TaxID=3383029 RepID=UPI003AF87461
RSVVFERHGEHQELHHLIRRQRQMGIIDMKQIFIAFGGTNPPPPQAFYFKGFCEIFFSKILAILASQPPFLAHSSKHLYMIQITFLDPLQCAPTCRSA